ncbi:type I polyketide synthase [Streptomyces sp. NPDC012751]|uniref:type I polyketide synthase n=1 Tax=Streptomyces sp. NPDC012751 TaxID=3364846 RepID=UPI0036977F07
MTATDPTGPAHRAHPADPTGPADQAGHIAVIGMAGRFPGAPTVERFWRNLLDGRESVTVLRDRLSPRQPEYTPAYGVLTDAAAFDAEYFGYSPQDALIIDPQQRLLLECAHEALERAGHGNPDRPLTGVFVGGSHTRHGERVRARLDELPFVDEWRIAHGNDADFLATRIAYKLGLTGPAVSVLTACSTSLVAVHSAVQALLAGDCDIALAGGASVLPEAPATRYVPGSVIAPDGHCRAFDAAAAGTVGASAVGLVVLRPLADALAAGDHVHAVIRGSAVNNDGRDKIGFTAPSVSGQATAVRNAQLVAGVDAEEIGYVEAHGTGTPLGDPIEVAALTKAFRESTDRRGYCRIGSVKTNIGHADAAAGVVGLIKTVLCVENGVLPASLHFESPNPDIDFAASPFEVNSSTRPWDTADGRPRVAGVNSLGLGGTNAHVVVAEAPPPVPTSGARPQQLLLVSGRTPAAADLAARQLAEHLADNPATDLADAAWTLGTGRDHHAHRRFVVADDTARAAAALRADGLAGGTAEPTGRPVAFMFPGQGGQDVGMAAELYAHEPVFRRYLDDISELAADPLGMDLRDVLFPDGERERAAAAERMGSIAVGQPAVFAVQYALARLLMSWGVRPRAVVGHSLGAYAAGCLAGVFSLPDAVRLVVGRGRLLGSLPAGGMAAVRLPESEVTPLLPPGLSVGAVNGPGQCTVTGPADLVARFARQQADRAVETRLLRIATAGHSALVEPIMARFAGLLSDLELAEPRLPMVSDTTGQWAGPGVLRSVDHWVNHLRRPVRFGQALTTLFGSPELSLLDIGPGRTLATLAQQHPGYDGRLVAHASPHPAEATSARTTLLRAVGRLWSSGTDVDPDALHSGERRRRVALPTYPFERRHFLVPATAPGRTGTGASGHTTAPWTGSPATEANPGTPPGGTADGGFPDRHRPREAADGHQDGPGVPEAAEEHQDGHEVLEAVLDAFRNALGIPDVEPHDGFLDLGGDSLLAAKLAAWATAEFRVPVSAADVLRGTGAASLTRLIRTRGRAAAVPAPRRAPDTTDRSDI